MKLFEEFSPTGLQDWRAAVERELKGKDFKDFLEVKDSIEGLDFSKYGDSRVVSESTLSYKRSSRSKSNTWGINQEVYVSDEKEANKRALSLLNLGADSLCFVLEKEEINWGELFDLIGLNYIEVQFKVLNENQALELAKEWKTISSKPMILANQEMFPSLFKLKQAFAFRVNGYGMHQIGANVQQELTYALSAGHQKLYTLLEAGYSIDDAAAMLRFDFGIGANYFLEISKFRVFRKLWSNIISGYEPMENCSHSCYIYAKTGFVNKSLKDPHTNLLRQTTEALSAINGAANELTVQPYDQYSNKGASELSSRMAINISHLLKEESYMDKVIDPLGGSYNIEKIGADLEAEVWSTFQEMEKTGGWDNSNVQQVLLSKISDTAAARVEAVKSNERQLIGINTYMNPDKVDLEWSVLPTFMGVSSLNLEKALA
jgi:methylmalonyl-CoA mutase